MKKKPEITLSNVKYEDLPLNQMSPFSPLNK